MRNKRLAAALGAALLAVPLIATPAHAAGFYSCTGGAVHPMGSSYHVSGHNCGGLGISDVTVTLRGGSAAGSYLCQTVLYFPTTANLGGFTCQPA
ncbi:hypothetical protein ACIBEJ_46310 [Nonomuraea sp. NPDC050790]|uniref:hypothetical protein n=1 Tax=Nonomuraea sp. NPDC050790 TaxID=3364371 RepID=UPI00379A543D